MFRTLLCAAVALVICVGGLIADEVKGKIKSVGAEKITVTGDDGKDVVVNLTKDVKVIRGKKDLEGGVSKLKEGAEVTVSYDKKDGKNVGTEIKVAGKKK